MPRKIKQQKPEIEIVNFYGSSLRYLEHGWPTELCRWHAHQECEIHLILETSGRMFIGDHIGPFAAGQLFMTGPLLPHNWVTDEAAYQPVKVRDMLIQFEHSRLLQAGSFLPELSNFAALFEQSERGILFEGFDPNEARSRLASIRDTSGVETLLNFVALLERLDAWKGKVPLSTLTKSHGVCMGTHAEMANVIEYIISNYTKRLSVEQLAARFDMTQKNLSQSFRRHTGSLIVDFINRIRIEQACRMLAASDQQINAIATAVGFTSLANFNRTFRIVTGMSPRDHRRQLKEKVAKEAGA